jgi:hypothetical protein
MVIGQRIGPYEVTARLGEGGMGEVYRARDTRLDRQVALKVLTASVATDPDRLARFEREAKALEAAHEQVPSDDARLSPALRLVDASMDAYARRTDRQGARRASAPRERTAASAA